MTALKKAISRKTAASVPHGVEPQIVVTLYPGGTIGLREAGRRKSTEVCLDIGGLYVRAVQNRVATERMNRAKARKAERKLRRELR